MKPGLAHIFKKISATSWGRFFKKTKQINFNLCFPFSYNYYKRMFSRHSVTYASIQWDRLHNFSLSLWIKQLFSK